MPRESVLLSTHRDSLTIEDFIFHVILKGEEVPRYFDMVTFADNNQRQFFTDLILAAAEGTQYNFADRENSDFVRNCQAIIDNPKDNFVSLSKKLTHGFHELHSGNVNDGVFVVARITIIIDRQRQSFIALLKVDYARVYQQVAQASEDNQIRITFNEIHESIAEDKSKIQKWALIDIGNHFAWDVLAKQRGRLGQQADTSEAISDYFKRFLGVTERESASNLTRSFVSQVSVWARQQEGLPEDEIPNNYKARAIAYMESSDNFNTDAFINLVVRDEDPERKQRMAASLREFLADKGLAGQAFTPTPNSLPKAQKKNKLTTGYGVVITWEGEAQDSGISIDHEKREGYKYITIKTPDFDLS